MGDERQQLGARASTAVTPHVQMAAGHLFAEYAFLIPGGLDATALQRACVEAETSNISPHWRLVSSGVLTAQRYIELLEAEIGRHAPGTAGLRTEIVDGMSARPSQIAAAAADVRARGNAPLILLRQHIDWSEAPHSRKLRADLAANGLKRRHPDLSAATPFAAWQLYSIPVLVGTAAGGLVVMPHITIAILAGAVAIPFVFVVGLRLLSLLIAMRLPPVLASAARVPDAELPPYTVLVPLFREADILADTVAALRRLDYPVEKLDILLILESIDQDTQAALRHVPLPPHMRAIIVPDQEPRTKPKALNYALRLSQGDYVVVFDAEDDPNPDQLRRAVAAFQSGGPGLMCMQGRLALDNREPGWLARQFMLEYAALFDAMLPALVHLRLPVPLGGTSNHFPRRVLEDLGGWDAWNVTEDADLGIRIARRGGRVEVLDSTTYEEAPEALGVWIRQRTRWLKGFMQTWLVHMRHPGRLVSELGLAGFLGFNAFLGGIVLSALIHPIFIALLLYELANGNLMSLPDTLLGGTLMTLALFNLAGGYAGGIGLAGLAASRRGMAGVLPRLAMMPIYWVLISVAAYRAALQLITNPYLWEKTPHVARTREPGVRGGVRRSESS